MTVGEKIKEARLQKGLTQQELADLLGYKSRSSINKIEVGGRDIPRSQIVQIAKALGVAPAYLMGWEDEKPSASPLPADKIHMIPIFESVSAGFGAYACSDIIDYMPLYFQNPSDVPDTICIKVQGDSMYPKIEDGDIIVVRRQESVDSGSIAVVLVDEEQGYVKKVIYDRETIELHSINPEYAPKIFKGKDVLRVRVVGLVKKIVKEV